MTMPAQSQTGLILPGVFRGQPLLESMLQTTERPLFAASAAMEAFLDQLRPETAPASWLPWLFWALGGEDYYRPDWSETKARLVLSRLVELYRSRGTVKGLGLHLSLLADQTLLAATQPPAKAFAGVSLATAEREAFRSRHPEIRIWPYQHMGVARTAMLGDCWPGGATAETKGRCFPAVTDAITRVGDRLEWYDPLPAAERPEGAFGADGAGVSRDSAGIFEIRVRGLAHGLFLGRWLVGSTVDHGAARRLYRVLPDPVGGRDPLAVQPSLAPVRVMVEDLRIAGYGPGLFLRNRYADIYPDRGGSFVGGHLVARHAEQRIGHAMRVFDPARTVGSRRAGIGFVGGFAFGDLPAHTMIVRVQMPGRTGRTVVWPGRPLPGHIAASDAPGRIARGRWAGGLARRAGATVLINTQAMEQIATGEQVLAGTHTVGEFVA